MSSVHTVQMVWGRLNPVDSAMEGMPRRRPSSGRGFELSAVSRQAGLVFKRLLKPNSALAIDFHIGTNGLDAAALHIGDMRVPAPA